MQSYREETSSRPVVTQLDPLPAPSSGSVRADDMSKYHTRYEQAMDPFEAFRGRVRFDMFLFSEVYVVMMKILQEATRAYDNLHPIERGVYILTRTVLANRRARTFFVIYALALHVLVLYTSYECATTSESQVQKRPNPF